MKEYPASKLSFSANKKEFVMKKLTIGIQADVEDEDTQVTYRDVIENCTNMEKDDINNLDSDQFKAIYQDILEYTYGITDNNDNDNYNDDGSVKKKQSK